MKTFLLIPICVNKAWRHALQVCGLVVLLSCCIVGSVTGGTLANEYDLTCIFSSLTLTEPTDSTKGPKKETTASPKSTTIVIAAPTPVTVDLDTANSHLTVMCPTDMDAIIALTITGGTGAYDYQYTLDGDSTIFTGSGDSITTLGVGLYSVTVADANGCLSNEVSVNITAESPCSSAPLAQADSLDVMEDVPTVLDVLANDDFSQNGLATNGLTVSIQPLNGNATVNDNGTPFDATDDFIDYTPALDFFGTDSLQYTLCDPDNNCATAMVYLDVTPVDDPVSASMLTITTMEGMPVVADPIAQSTAPDGVASLMITQPPLNGTASIDDNGTPGDPTDDTVIYTPDNGFVGADSLTYQLCDTDNDCATAQIMLTVEPANPVIAVNDMAAALPNETVSLLPAQNDTLLNAGAGMIVLVTLPVNGIAGIDDNGTPDDPTDDIFTYTSLGTFEGIDVCTYQICDVDGNCATAQISINVGDVSIPVDCNDPITGPLTVIDQISTGLACVDCGIEDIGNVIDGDLSNFVEISTATTPPAAALLSVKDMGEIHAAGQRVGFVIETPNAQIDLNAPSSFQLRTYLNNIEQETATVPLDPTTQIQSGIGAQKRVSFVTALPFDEIELIHLATASVDTTLRIYYAFEEPATGCDYTCEDALIAPVYNSAISSVRTVCSDTVTCSILTPDQLVDSDTANFATLAFTTIATPTIAYLSMTAGETIPAGFASGFALRHNETTGLLPVDVLDRISLNTYFNGVLQESVAASDATVSIDIGPLNDDLTLVSFIPTAAFDEIQLAVTESSSVGAEYYIYYGFVRLDTDGDGVPDCADKCVGDDNLDTDGDGLPNACDTPPCNVFAGLDENVCPDVATAQLLPAGAGQAWNVVDNNPGPAVVAANGLVTGLEGEGIYRFYLSDGMCTDTVALIYQQGALPEFCNDPIVGDNILIDTNNPTGGVCIGCGAADADHITNGDLSDYYEYTSALAVLFPTGLIAVRDTAMSYSGGQRVGYVIEVTGGLVTGSVLEQLQLRTYLNGSLQETASVENALLTGTAVPGSSNQMRVSFVTDAALDFDEVELVVLSTLNVATSLRVYYAFTEPVGGCPDLSVETCIESLLVNGPNLVGIDYARTGFSGDDCTDCTISEIGNLIDGDTTNVTSIVMTLGIGAIADLAVATEEEVPAGHIVGFALQELTQLLDVSVLDALTLTTYQDGVMQESVTGSSSAAMVATMDPDADIGMLVFNNNMPFNSLQLSVAGLLGGLSEIEILQALILADNDGDGVPDCVDKCCRGDDLVDLDGNGIPNLCEPLAIVLALPDVAVVQDGMPNTIDVLANDNFGLNGPGGDSIVIVVPPLQGTVSVNNNGTPGDPADDTVIYTPVAGFVGIDLFTYEICDALGSCAQAPVTVTVDPNFVLLDVKVMLQGAMLDNVDLEGVMRDDLRVEELIPALEPYTALDSFLHFGEGGGALITDLESVMADLGVNSVADWVFVELRDANDSTQVVATRAGVLQRDGDVMEVNGLTPLFFANVTAGEYFVSVRHRNHLGVMTAAPITLTTIGTTVDFTDTSIDLYHTSPLFDGYEQIVIDGRFALWAGNSNTSGAVIFSGENNDLDRIFNLIDQAPGNIFNSQSYILQTYNLGDVNLDGEAIFSGENNDVDPIFNNVDGHPRNIFRSQNFIIPEQLPQND